MTTLKIMRGVPASGKSTDALRLVAEEGFTRVNRDEIRFTLFGKYWGVDENVVTVVENAAIEAALRAGHNTVVDATNLNNKALKTKLSLASRYGAGVEFVDFPVSLTLALERNAVRERQVPPKAINEFFKRYKINPEFGVLPKAPLALPTFERYVPDTSLPTAYIVDTDGTVANHEGIRNPYDTTRYEFDTVHWHVAGVVRAIRDQDEHAIVALSGRDAKFRRVTEDWWSINGIGFDQFHFRSEGDARMDAIIKYELFRDVIAPQYNVLGAFDDRPQVIRMWRTIGVPVFDVGDGLEF